MKRIIATTAMALMLGTSAYAAEGHTMLKAYASEQPGDLYASEFIGMRIYAAENEWDAWDENARIKSGGEKEWDDIGEVDDIILGRNGEVKAVLLGVGGFVGIGEKDVAVTMDQIKMVREEGDSEDFFLVIKANKDLLTSVEPYQRADDMKTSSAARDATGAMERPMLTAPVITRDGYLEAERVDLTADRLKGARVYGANDEDVGEIDKLILGEDGTIQKVVIDVGGFLGIGEHPVGVTFDEIQVLRTESGDDFRVYIDATEEALEKQPAYKG